MDPYIVSRIVKKANDEQRLPPTLRARCFKIDVVVQDNGSSKQKDRIAQPLFATHPKKPKMRPMGSAMIASE